MRHRKSRIAIVQNLCSAFRRELEKRKTMNSHDEKEKGAVRVNGNILNSWGGGGRTDVRRRKSLEKSESEKERERRCQTSQRGDSRSAAPVTEFLSADRTEVTWGSDHTNQCSRQTGVRPAELFDCYLGTQKKESKQILGGPMNHTSSIGWESSRQTQDSMKQTQPATDHSVRKTSTARSKA